LFFASTKKDMSQSVLITGASGLVGQHLSQFLAAQKYEVKSLSRKPDPTKNIYGWDVAKGQIDQGALEGAETVVSLAGAGVADHRWTQDYKAEIYNSRIMGTRLLFEHCKQTGHVPRTFISASAVGVYEEHPELTLNENAPLSNSFLGSTCTDWEKEALKFETLGTRVVILRIGIVLGRERGFIPTVAKPMKFGLGAVLGSGSQMISWIHINDLVRVIYKAMQDESMQRVYNATSLEPISNRQMMRLMAKELKRPLWLPAVPPFILKLIFGEMSVELLADKKVKPERLLAAGFQFDYKTAEAAVKDLLRK
jgi:uncharacterized protein (TIGR01777 family)